MAKPPTQIWHKEWPQPAVDSFQLEGTGRLQVPQIWTFWMDFGQLFSTLGLVKVPPKVSERIEELDAPGVAHLCHTCRSRWFQLEKKNSPRFMWFVFQPPSSSSLSDSAKILGRIWQPWMTARYDMLDSKNDSSSESPLPLMRPRRFKCLPNTQIKQILRGGKPLQHGVPSMSPVVQWYKTRSKKDIQWKNL